jgi:hypothetical protein
MAVWLLELTSRDHIQQVLLTRAVLGSARLLAGVDVSENTRGPKPVGALLVGRRA